MDTAARSEYASEAATFRHGFRRYLRDLGDADQWRSARFGNAESVFEHDADRMYRLYADGWSRFGWPEWAGGFGGTQEHRMAYFDELTRARLPQPLQHQSLERFLPTLIEHAPDLAAVYLPQYLRGTEWWSTNAADWPACGDPTTLAISALAAGRDNVILRGPQTWSYIGPNPTQLMLLAKTEHGAASMFLVSAAAPGSAIRRVPAAGGRPDIVEVTVNHLRVAGSRVIGDVGAGLSVMQRISLAPRGLGCYADLSKLLFDLGLLREAMATHGSSQGQRQRFAQVYVDVVSAQALASETIRAEAPQLPGGADVETILLRQVRQRVSDLILDVGRSHIIRGTNAGGESLGSARADWWYSRAADAAHPARRQPHVGLDGHSSRKVQQP
ncbi:acyl-CoA dehydrogenase [Mycolicibacterium vanbaalenii]|uniref:acyl-CoA dehydrogenase n=1 Tax=Mycolicibacterium vanbaalenii TaxID=110539 RepID=UPI0013306F4F|nr:acyl-CoA dehydrogenase [Mycolicibacterium vanbaalenii]